MRICSYCHFTFPTGAFVLRILLSSSLFSTTMVSHSWRDRLFSPADPVATLLSVIHNQVWGLYVVWELNKDITYEFGISKVASALSH